jgi:hypothetical protein
MMIGSRARRAAAAGADGPHGLDAVHLRHLDVHRHQVGRELVQLAHCDLAVHGGTDDLDRGVLGEHVRDDLPDDDGIVDDHHPNRVHVLLLLPRGLPALCRLFVSYRHSGTALERGDRNSRDQSDGWDAPDPVRSAAESGAPERLFDRRPTIVEMSTRASPRGFVMS